MFILNTANRCILQNYTSCIVVVAMTYRITALEEYCQNEIFVASCSSDEVIIINEATFGRMRTGKCISESLAFFMGCSSNVLDFMEHQCSGRSSCSMPVALLLTNFMNCTSKLVSYLEVAYSCVKGSIICLTLCVGLYNLLTKQVFY